MVVFAKPVIYKIKGRFLKLCLLIIIVIFLIRLVVFVIRAVYGVVSLTLISSPLALSLLLLLFTQVIRFFYKWVYFATCLVLLFSFLSIFMSRLHAYRAKHMILREFL